MPRSMEKSINQAASKAAADVTRNQTSSSNSNTHNQYANAFSRNLHEKDIKFERTPNVSSGNGRNCQPDFVIKDKAVVEIKAKSDGFSSHDRNVQMAGYKDATGLPTYGVNFGKSSNVNVRKF